MSSDLTKDPQAVVKAFLEWLGTDEGKACVKESNRRAEEFSAKLRAARNIPWEKLHEPFTI